MSFSIKNNNATENNINLRKVTLSFSDSSITVEKIETKKKHQMVILE